MASSLWHQVRLSWAQNILHVSLNVTFVADGILRLYRNYDPATSNAPVQLVSAFRALSEIVRPVPHGVGTIVDWQQLTGHLHVSGDSRLIRIWDAHNEMQVMVCILSLPHVLFRFS